MAAVTSFAHRVERRHSQRTDEWRAEWREQLPQWLDDMGMHDLGPGSWSPPAGFEVAEGSGCARQRVS
jgi:hypothetical protein